MANSLDLSRRIRDTRCAILHQVVLRQRETVLFRLTGLRAAIRPSKGVNELVVLNGSDPGQGAHCSVRLLVITYNNQIPIELALVPLFFRRC